MKPEELIARAHATPSLRILLHLLFWCAFFGLHVYMGEISLYNEFNGTPAAWLVPGLNTLQAALVFYLLVYLLLPRFFAQRKWVKGGASLLLLGLLYAGAGYCCELLLLKQLPGYAQILETSNPTYYRFLQNHWTQVLAARVLSLGILYQLVMAVALPLGIKLGLEYFRQRLQAVQLAKENLQLEFNFLKAQVNPHFLFNTLNNIYGLILSDHKMESAETVARLAGFMRYTLYDCNGEKNGLEGEAQLLQDYLELEKIRLNRTAVTFRKETDEQGYAIPPLLFMPVVENAFKYCIERKECDSSIDIGLSAREGQLEFRVRNTCPGAEAPKKGGGIGLQNLKKRLEHYYPGHHKLHISKEEGIFTVAIHINLTPV